MSNILITGGAGFIGSHIAERLLKENHYVVCVDNLDPYYDPALKRSNISLFKERENFRFVEGDIMDKKFLEDLMKEESIEYIFHEAAQPGVRASVEDPEKSFRINIGGTLNILESSLKGNVRNVIYASSSSVYGKISYLPMDEKHPSLPLSPYGVSKLAAENYGRVFSDVHGLGTISLRLFTVYGPRMRPDLAISIFARKALKGETIEIFGDGKKTRDFTFIDDVVEAHMLAMKKRNGEIYNVGGGNNISILQLAEKIIELTESNSKIIFSCDQIGDAMHTLADTKKAKEELGWAAKVKIEEGLEKVIEWMKK